PLGYRSSVDTAKGDKGSGGSEPAGQTKTPEMEFEPASPSVARMLAGPPTLLWARDFSDLQYEWRRLFGEAIGTFFLVLVAAGAGVVNATTGGSVGRTASVVAPALMVMAIILATGAVSGAHLNPVVSVAFALRREFPWRRVPLYVVAQVVGGLLACLFLRAMFGTAGGLGSTIPGLHVSDPHAVLIEAVLTCGLVTTIL